MSMTATRTCKVVRPGEATHGKQGLPYGAGISAESVGATGICMHLVTIPPGSMAEVHLHEHHETAISVLSGDALTWYGDGLRECLTVKAGEFLYIPAGMPHQPTNPSATDPCTAVIARTDPSEQESVVVLPGMDRRRG